jgi:hypothetical protein
MVVVIPTTTIRKVYINKTNHSKTFHLGVEINQAFIEGLVDINVLMLVMAASVMKELDIVHLVSGHETYKTTSSMVIQEFGKIIDIPIIIGRVVY